MLPKEDLDSAQIIWDYMFLSDEPSKVDYILGLGSNDLGVADDASLLYFQGVAPYIIFSGNVGRITEGLFDDSEANALKVRAIELGVPERAILTEDKSTNTGENIRFSQQLLMDSNRTIKSIVIVHKPYMLRRDYATFMRQWDHAETITVSCWARPITFEEYLKKDVGSPEQTINIMVGDFDRILKYPAKGFQIEQDVPPVVMKAFTDLVKKRYDQQLISKG